MKIEDQRGLVQRYRYAPRSLIEQQKVCNGQ